MKKITLLLSALVLSTPLAALAANFEGKVTMKMSGPTGSPQQLNFSLKEGLSRIDMSMQGQTAAMIFEPAKQQMTMLMPEQKMYMVHSVADQQRPGGAAAGEQATFEKTGEKEKILGYDCVKYVSKSKEGTSDIWITDQLGTFMGLGGGNPMAAMGGGRRGNQGGAALQAWERELRGKDAFPLRVVTRSNEGKETFRMEATAVEKQSLPASLFTVPSDYQDMGAMMRGMGMPPGMPPGR